MRFAVLGFFIMISLVVHAQEADCETTTEKELRPMIEVAAVAVDETTCPNRAKLKNLCMLISGRVKDSSGKNKYLYQSKFQEAGCVQASDSEEVKAQKIREAWVKYEDDLKCNSTQFDVMDGHLLKYAVSYKFDDFLDEAIKWKVNLNKVDAIDGRTTLDYIKYQIERNKGNALEEKFQIYYDKLKAAGAKHKSEL